MVEQRQKQVAYFDFLRTVAMIAVVILHTAASNWNSIDVHTLAWRTFNVYDGAVRWGVPIFTMISGAIFLDGARELSIRKLYSQNILRLVSAFLFWSTVYAALGLVMGDRSIAHFFAHIIQGHYHMWFLFMIIGLYIITPLLRRITVDRQSTKYFLLLSLVFTFVVPALIWGIKFIDTFAGANGELLSLANNVYGSVHYHFTLGFSAYFVLGYYLHTVEISKRTEVVIYILGVLGFGATILLTKYMSYYLGSPTTTFYGNMTLNVLLESVAVFTLAKCRISKIIKSERTQKAFKKMSKLSFGIYLMHVGFIALLGKMGLSTLSFNPILSVTVIALVVSILSYCASALVHRIPFLNKYIV